jgi:hypothetical protein
MILDAFVEHTLRNFLESGAPEKRINLSHLDHGDAAHLRRGFLARAKKPNGSPGVSVTAGPKDGEGGTCIIERGCIVLMRMEALPPILVPPDPAP